jgi:hypothetical protein
MHTSGEDEARRFFKDLGDHEEMQIEIDKGLEALANSRGYHCTAEELDRVLRELWKAGLKEAGIMYSEPPGLAP